VIGNRIGLSRWGRRPGAGGLPIRVTSAARIASTRSARSSSDSQIACWRKPTRSATGLAAGQRYDLGDRALWLHRTDGAGPPVVFLPGAGLVGLDFLPPEARTLDEEMKRHTDAMPELTDEQKATARGQYAQLYADWPAAEREALTDYHLDHWRTAIEETRNFDTEIYDELRGGGPLPDVPLIVLTAGARNPFWAQFADRDLIDRAHDGINAMHQAMAPPCHAASTGSCRTPRTAPCRCGRRPRSPTPWQPCAG